MYLETTNQTIYAAEAAIAYPTILLSKTFSKITVEAKADNTKNVVDTGIPTVSYTHLTLPTTGRV